MACWGGFGHPGSVLARATRFSQAGASFDRPCENVGANGCTVSEWLRQVHAGVRDALANKELPLDRALAGQNSSVALVDIIFAWNEEPPREPSWWPPVRRFRVDTLATQFELALSGAP